MRTIDAEAFEPDLSWFDGHFGSDAAAVFDFDGVLSSAIEDLVYKLPERMGERDTLVALAVEHGLTPDLFATPYLRHLVLQAVLVSQRAPARRGPLLRLAEQLEAAGRPFFVLTARSGLAAVERLLAFIRERRLTPQEVFCVGRVAKGRQLAVIRKAVPEGRKVVYFEDTLRHVRNSNQQDIPGFSTVRVAWSAPPWSKAEDMRDALLAGVSHPVLTAA